ncbi:hypothetical protein NC653_001304 [Populus alba x Populus x berolinensis]|uniref:Uncharacterized protein n=1 Tax=Populus alba x Populus x berolinensis TaxID=444605 RepID=A0AAD6RKN2_9ROSI|nr:hypothetical protein NC653_001304 [Populus alba x Populus x berolinensis]
MGMPVFFEFFTDSGLLFFCRDEDNFKDNSRPVCCPLVLSFSLYIFFIYALFLCCELSVFGLFFFFFSGFFACVFLVFFWVLSLFSFPAVHGFFFFSVFSHLLWLYSQRMPSISTVETASQPLLPETARRKTKKAIDKNGTVCVV